TIVIAEMLGVDPRDFARFKRWSDARSQIFNTARTPEQSAELAAAREGLDDYFARAVEERRYRRGTDLVSSLVAAEESGDRLTASISSGPTPAISPLAVVRISVWGRRLPAPRHRSPFPCCSSVFPVFFSIHNMGSSIRTRRSSTG